MIESTFTFLSCFVFVSELKLSPLFSAGMELVVVNLRIICSLSRRGRSKLVMRLSLGRPSGKTGEIHNRSVWIRKTQAKCHDGKKKLQKDLKFGISLISESWGNISWISNTYWFVIGIQVRQLATVYLVTVQRKHVNNSQNVTSYV